MNESPKKNKNHQMHEKQDWISLKTPRSFEKEKMSVNECFFSME
jgi:hypothetical protein